MLDGVETDKGIQEFFKKWEQIGQTPLGICHECQSRGQAAHYANRASGEQITLCIECAWHYVELMAEYIKMETLL